MQLSANRERVQGSSNADLPGVNFSNVLEDQLLAAVSEHLWCELNGEAVILSLRNGKYYGMNSIGAEIWKYLQSPTRIHKIHKNILADYDVDPDECLTEIKEFVSSMLDEGLVEIKNASAQKICKAVEPRKDTLF